MKYTISLSYSFIILLLSSCCHEESTEYIFNETYCANPWQRTGSWSNDDEKLVVISTYLSDSLEIDFKNLNINLENSPEACQACSCHSGKVVELSASNIYEDILVSKGFSER